MKLAWVLSIAAACGSPRPAPLELKPFPKPPPPVVPTLPASPTPIAHKPRAAVEAPHAGGIQLLTATPEGDAVLSLDELGGVRLWPSLDGTREPKLVELPAAKDLALGHRAGGYTAVARDEVGGLYVANLDAEGRTLAHTTLGIDPAFDGMAMTPLGLIAWRVDHHVLLVDGDGATKADLPTEPRQRIVDICARGTKALALLETDGGRKARWLTLEPELAWGAWIDHPHQDLVGIAIALSPDLAHFAIASKTDKTGQISIYEAAGGKLVNTSPLAAASVDLAFVDDKLLAVASTERGLHWMVIEDNMPLVASSVSVQPRRQRHILAAGGGNAILPHDGELMLTTMTATQFLGYQTMTPQVTASGPDGKLLVVGNPGAVLLDANLRESTKPNLGITVGESVAAAEWVGGEHWLVESTKLGAVNKLELAIVKTTTGSAWIVRDDLPEVHYLAYEPTTQLVTMSFGSQSQVARLDVGKHTLDQLARSAKKTPYEEVALAPLAPKLARGQQLVEIVIRDKPTVRWFKDANALGTPASTVTVNGSYLGSDAAGRVYAWRTGSDGKLEVAIYTDGKETGSLPTQGAASLWPDPTATLLAEAAGGVLTLYRGTTPLWTRQVDGVHEVQWLTDGALAVTHATGIARLDVKTGAVTAVRCGWEFGLSSKPHPPSPRIEPICAQLSR